MNFRTYFILIFLLVSLFLIFSPLIFRKTGVVVVSTRNKDCKISEGDIITQISGKIIRNTNDFYEFVSNTKAGKYYPMVVNNGPGGCKAVVDGDIGIDVSDIESTGLKFEKSIGGGVEILIVSNKELSHIELENSKRVIQSRFPILGITDGIVEVKGGKIIIFSSPSNNFGLLIKRGKIEGRIRQSLEVRNRKSEVKIGDSRYSIKILNGEIIVNNSEVKTGEKFYLENIVFVFVNGTNTSLILDSIIFDNRNVVKALPSFAGISFEPSINSFKFIFPIELDEKSGEKFAKISDGLSTIFVGSQTSLNGMLLFYIDGTEISELRIPLDLAGESIKTISIVGFGKTVNEVVAKKTSVELAIAGELPVEFKIEKITPTSPNYFLIWLISGVVIILSTIVILLKLDKRLKIIIITIILLQCIYIFGIFSIIQKFVLWRIDSYTLFSVCIVLIINTFGMVNLRKGRIKLSTITFISGFVLLFTQFIGFGVTLIIGVLLDCLITKPFYKSFT